MKLTRRSHAAARWPRWYAISAVLVFAAMSLTGCNQVPNYDTPDAYFRDMNTMLDDALKMAGELPPDEGPARERALDKLRDLVERIRDYKFASMDRLPRLGNESFRQWYLSFEYLDWILVEAQGGTYDAANDADSRQRTREQARILIQISKDWKEQLERDVQRSGLPHGPSDTNMVSTGLEVVNGFLDAALKALNIEPLNELNLEEARSLLGKAIDAKRVTMFGMPLVRGKRFLDWYDWYRALDASLEGVLRLRHAAPAEDRFIRVFLESAKEAKEHLEKMLVQ